MRSRKRLKRVYNMLDLALQRQTHAINQLESIMATQTEVIDILTAIDATVTQQAASLTAIGVNLDALILRVGDSISPEVLAKLQASSDAIHAQALVSAELATRGAPPPAPGV